MKRFSIILRAFYATYVIGMLLGLGLTLIYGDQYVKYNLHSPSWYLAFFSVTSIIGILFAIYIEYRLKREQK